MKPHSFSWSGPPILLVRTRVTVGLLASLLLLIPSLWRGALQAGEGTRSLAAHHIQSQIRARQDNRRFTCQGELICGISLIPDFYRARNFEPVWSTPMGLASQAGALLEEIRKIEGEGLAPEDYHYSRLVAVAGYLDATSEHAETGLPALRADFDLLMTDAAFLLAAHILGGRVNPETIHGSWSAFSHEVDLIRLLNDGLQGGRVAHLMQGLHPPYSGYAGLRQALSEYRRMAANGGWPLVDDGPSLKKGDMNPAVGQVRERLIASGDLDSSLSPVPDHFDESLETAVKGFQHRHGLEADGVVGKQTRRVLNVPVEQRIEQLLINMERWRWIPNDLGQRYLVINIADFKLTMVDQGQARGVMRVVVGRSYRKTPVFSGTMTYLDFNPFWNIPRRLAIEDILPHIRKDPGYVARQGIRVFSGWSRDAVELAPEDVDWAAFNKDYFPIRLRQDPGPKNALGRIKFMFPNKHAVYLHDTPARSLFDAVSRGFSSGCIRVEDPVTLAAFVLEGTQGWDRETIEVHLGDGQRRIVRLQQPISVHLLYWTAWSDDQGMVFFREDIYARDLPLLRALKDKPAPQARMPAGPLPGAHRADIDMHEIGSGVVSDPPNTQIEGDFADR